MTSTKLMAIAGVAAATSLCAVLPFCTKKASAATTPNEEAAVSRAYLHSYSLPSNGVAIEGYCPVAYFAVDRAIRGKAEFSSTHEGVTYWFVSADAKEMFDAEPAKYVPAYGGWCAFGMSIEDKFPVDPRKFKIVEGRLLLFLGNAGVDARKLWDDGDERTMLRKAGAHWSKVQG